MRRRHLRAKPVGLSAAGCGMFWRDSLLRTLSCRFCATHGDSMNTQTISIVTLCRRNFSSTAFTIFVAIKLLLISAVPYVEGTVFSDSLKICQQQCVDRNLVVPLPRGAQDWNDLLTAANLTERRNACNIGCKDLESINSTCNERCSPTAVLAVDSCQQGCRAVTDIFLHLIQDLLYHVKFSMENEDIQGITTVWKLDQPYQNVISEITATEVKWAVHSRSYGSNAPFRVTVVEQKMFKEESMGSTVIVPSEFTSVLEVRLCIFWRTYMLVSRTFRQAINGTGGLPRPPKMISQLQVSAKSYVICWNSPLSRSLLYNVTLSALDGTRISSEVTPNQCFLFRNLPSENCCRASIGYASTQDSSIDVAVKLELANSEVILLESDLQLVFTNGTAIMKLYDINDFIVTTEPKIIPFEMAPGRSITALASIAVNRLLVALDDGSIYRIILSSDGNTQSDIIRHPDGDMITQIDVDHMQQKMYAVVHKKGILRCELSDCENGTMLTINSINYIDYIAVDSWNGFIYCIKNGGEVFKAPLFPYEAPLRWTFPSMETLADIGLSSAIQIDYENFQLVSIAQNGSLLGISLVDQSVSDIRSDFELSDNYKDVQRMRFAKNRVFLISSNCKDSPHWDRCLYSEERDPEAKKLHLNRYLVTGRVVDFSFLRNGTLPPVMPPPSAIGLMTTANAALITWRPPILMPYQAREVEWRNVQYECRMTSEPENPEVLAPTRVEGTSYQVSISPGLQYHASVRACISTVCSSYTSAINTAFTPFTEAPFLLINQSGNIFGPLGTPELNYSVGLPLPKDMSTPFAVDPTTRSLYTFDQDEGSIFRTGVNGIREKYLDSVTIKFLSILPQYAIMIVASDYLILSYRLTSTFDQTIYSCDSVSDCGEVVGVAGDDDTGDVFFLIHNTNGTVSLFGLNQQVRTPYFIASSHDFPMIRQLVVAKEKLAFVTKSGEVGICDKKLGSLNIDASVVGASLIQHAMREPINAINFTQEITLAEGSRNILTWNIDPPYAIGKVIYKITMYKDKFGGERLDDYSLSPSYTLSPSLLEQWPSRQKYDVQVDAINAWTTVSANQTGLLTPTKPPTPPTNLQIYATQQKTVDGARALIDLFWSEPVEWNGDKSPYLVNCSVDGGEDQSSEVPYTTRTFSFYVKSGRVSCEVAARTEPALQTFSSPIEIDSSELRPLVRLFAVDSAFNVIFLKNWSSPVATRRKRQSSSAPTPIAQQAIAFIGNDLYSIKKDSDSSQTYLLRLDSNNVNSILHKVSIGGEIAGVDAVISDWVANRLIFVWKNHLMQILLDALKFNNAPLSVINPRRLMNLSAGAGDAKELLYDPFNNTAYLLTKNGSLFALYLNEGVEMNMHLSLDCLKAQTVTAMMSEFTWNRATSPILYVLTWSTMKRIDLINSKCEDITVQEAAFGEKGLKSVSLFSIADKNFVFTNSTDLIFYERESGAVTSRPVDGSPLKQILTVSQSTQPYPDRSCFLFPESNDFKFTVRSEDKSGAVITITEPQRPNACPGVSVPPTQYAIHLKRRNSDKVRVVNSISNFVHIDNDVLDRETDYDVSVSYFNRYVTPPPPAENVQSLRTGYGYPSAPQELAAFTLTPDTVVLCWRPPTKLNAPAEEIRYRITSQLSGSSTPPSAIGAQQAEGSNYAVDTTDAVSCLTDPCSAKIPNLRQSTDYKFWVRAIHVSHLNAQFSEDPEALSTESAVKTKDTPGTLRQENVDGTSVSLRWNALEAASPTIKIFVQYRLSGTDASWKTPANASFASDVKTLIINITALRSATSYDFRYLAEYEQSYHYGNRNYPFNEIFYHAAQQIKTKPGKPLPPASIGLVKENGTWIVRWEEPLSDGGSPITSYALEHRKNENDEWVIAEPGLPEGIFWWKPPRADYITEGAEFRIRAKNSEGFGDYAYSREPKAPAQKPRATSAVWEVIVVLLVAAALVSVFIGGLIVYYRRNDRMRRKTKPSDIGMKHFRNGITPSQLPPQIANDLKSIPRVPKTCISLSRMIGKGSFGEVFEGVACGLAQSPTKSFRVAVKTLKSGHSEGDRLKFLKEAILMNNFDHPNIVKLLGVSFESEPYFLIIELMEGGDLLGFLRSSRPSDCLPSQLSLAELIGMMVDVGRGGAYLESNRHVHRDLAARNCLISSRNSVTRITKIADFGLARDVYTNDYYRVHGEDFLPLRWLSPESITEGVFTSKSDVWSFGILLWEILTLGQQPYSGKNNVQVMSFVKGGGKPERPPFCPDEIFKIVEEAWVYDADKRPSFADILPELEALRGNPAYQDDTPFPPTFIPPSTSNFDLSVDSNNSHCESPDRSGSARFDKSDNPSTKMQGRPSILRSLRKERPKPPPSREELESRELKISGRASVLSNDTLSTHLDADYSLSSGGGYDNDGFISSSDYYETPSRRVSVVRPMPRNKAPAPPPPVPQILIHPPNLSSSSTSKSPSPENSPCFRPARVSRV